MTSKKEMTQTLLKSKNTSTKQLDLLGFCTKHFTNNTWSAPFLTSFGVFKFFWVCAAFMKCKQLFVSFRNLASNALEHISWRVFHFLPLLNLWVPFLSSLQHHMQLIWLLIPFGWFLWNAFFFFYSPAFSWQFVRGICWIGRARNWLAEQTAIGNFQLK